MSFNSSIKKRQKRRFDISSEELSEEISPLKSVKTSSKKKRVDENFNDKSIFGELISKCGYILKRGSQPNLLQCDQAVFQKDLKKAIRFYPEFGREETISKFVTGLENYLSDVTHLKSALLYSQTSQDCNSGRGGQQDSLIRLLLNIDDLQPKLVVVLTERLLEVSYDDEENTKTDIPCLILANLRWLDHIVDSSSMTDKMLDLLQGTPVQVQREIINFLPNILEDENHPRISEVLCNLYQSTSELTASILDALSSLTLPTEALSEIRRSVLKSLHAVKVQNLPVVVKFLLHDTPSSVSNEVVSDIREKILLPGERTDVIVSSQLSSSRKRTPVKKKQCELSDLDVLVFSNIKVAILVHKHLASAWLKAINDVKDAGSFLTIDFLILSLIYRELPSKRKSVESIFRNMVRLGLSADTYLTPIFKNHKAVLIEYFESVKKIAAQLLRSSEAEIAQFGSAVYRYCFVNLESYQQQEVILSLLSHLGDNENVRLTSLCTLSQLAHEYSESMNKYTMYLKGSLDIIDILSLREAKMLMDTIIHLAHSSQNEAPLREELSILIRKQLSQTSLKYKRLGVLSAVLTLKNSVGMESESTEESVNNSDDEETEESLILEGPLKEAEVLFHTVKESTLHSPPCSALFMDELATNILKNGLNSKLEKWISEKIISDFEDLFAVDCTTTTVDGFPFSVSFQWNLDDITESEKSKSIAVPIARLVLDDFESHNSKDGNKIIVTLSPHFRLMRMVESHLNNGDLSSIDALLGCGILAPEPVVYEKFSTLSDKEQMLSLSCLFYTINWFRELVNAFVTQKDPELKGRVIFRLRKIIKLQELLAKLLPLKPSYQPPPAVFDFDVTAPVNSASSNVSKKAKPKASKKKQKKEKVEETQNKTASLSQISGINTQSQKPSTSAAQCVDTVADLSNYRAFLRELHLDVFNLLFRNLNLDSEPNEENVKYLLLSEAEFLLADLNLKFSRVFEAGTKRLSVIGKSGPEKDVGFSHFDVFSGSEVAEQALRYVKPICAHLEKIFNFFEEIISENDGIEDSPVMFTEHTIRITNVFSGLFTTLRLFLSWPGLHTEQHSTVLIKILRLIGKNLERDSVNQMTTGELVDVSFRYLSNFNACIISISAALSFIQCLDSLIVFSKNKELNKKLVSIIEGFLKKDWYTYGGNQDKGTQFNQTLQKILKIYFKHCSDPVAVVHTLSSNGIKEISESRDKDPSSEFYPTMRKNSLSVYYSALLENLVSGASKMLSAISSRDDDNRELEIWNLSIKTLHLLVEPLKNLKLTVMFNICLKNAKRFLELFLRKGMPLMDKCLQTHQKEVTSLLKNLQINTRFLQHLCTHVKCNQDARLMGFVPILKKLLETIVFRVKAMLTLNRCQDAFWLGNLKNRDLQGEEIQSQSMEESEDNETENGDEAEAEEDEDALSDVELDDDDSECPRDARQDSYSVTY